GIGRDIPSTISIDAVQTALHDLWKGRPHAKARSKSRTQQIEVHGDGSPGHGLEKIHPKWGDEFIAQREDLKPISDFRVVQQTTILCFSRLDNQERNSSFRCLFEKMEDRVRLAASSNAGYERVPSQPVCIYCVRGLCPASAMYNGSQRQWARLFQA